MSWMNKIIIRYLIWYSKIIYLSTTVSSTCHWTLGVTNLCILIFIHILFSRMAPISINFQKLIRTLLKNVLSKSSITKITFTYRVWVLFLSGLGTPNFKVFILKLQNLFMRLIRIVGSMWLCKCRSGCRALFFTTSIISIKHYI